MKPLELSALKFINLFAIIGVIIVNALSNILPFNNITTGELSDQVNVLFTPAGYVFSIWSVIYVFLIIWAVRPFFIKHTSDKEAYEKIGTLFLLNGLLNSFWLYLFHYQYFVATLFVMACLLINLIMIYRIIYRVSGTSLWMKLPFSIYIGWISVATIVNVGIFFNTLGFEEGLFLGAESWTVLLLWIAAMIAIAFTSYFKDTIYPLVFVWAFIGIAFERFETFPIITINASIAALLIAGYSINRIIKMKSIYERSD